MAMECREDTEGDKAEKKGTRDKNYWLKRLWLKNFWCSDTYGMYELKGKKSRGCLIGVKGKMAGDEKEHQRVKGKNAEVKTSTK